jgi:hypothetical protein
MEEAVKYATEKAEEYYSWLVRIGEIVPEKTAEEIAREATEEQLRFAEERNQKQDELIQKQTQMLEMMMQKIEDISKQTGGVSNGTKQDVGDDTEPGSKPNAQDNSRPIPSAGSIKKRK